MPQASMGCLSSTLPNTVTPIFCTENVSPIAAMTQMLLRTVLGAMLDVRRSLLGGSIVEQAARAMAAATASVTRMNCARINLIKYRAYLWANRRPLPRRKPAAALIGDVHKDTRRYHLSWVTQNVFFQGCGILALPATRRSIAAAPAIECPRIKPEGCRCGRACYATRPHRERWVRATHPSASRL